MAQPTAYAPAYSFLTIEATESWFPGTEIDVELHAIQNTLNQIRHNLALIQRDDGALIGTASTGDSTEGSTGAISTINVKDYGALGDGETDDSGAINEALLAASDLGIGTVYMPGGTYIVTDNPVFMQPYVTLKGSESYTEIKQGNTANLPTVVDFTDFYGGATATYAVLRDLTIDGNRDNNLGGLFLGVDKRLVYFGNTDYVTIDNCYMQNGPGYGVAGSSQTGLRFTNNSVTNTEQHCFFMAYVVGNYDVDCVVTNNYFGGNILFHGVNGVTCANNRLVGTMVGDVSAPMRVNISGTTVTWVSGPTFATAKSGMILIGKAGAVQQSIESVTSTTSLKLDASGGTETNILAMFGHEDMLGIGGVRRGTFTGNEIRGGCSFGLSLYGFNDGFGAVPIKNCVISNNYCYGQGKNGFTLLGGGGSAYNLIITENQMVNTCLGGLAGNAAGVGGNHSFLVAEPPVTNIFFDDNFSQDDGGNTYSWLGAAVGTTGIIVGQGNNQTGAANNGYFPSTAVTQTLRGNNASADAYTLTLNGNGDLVFRAGVFGGSYYVEGVLVPVFLGTTGTNALTFRTNEADRINIAGDGTIKIRPDTATPAAGSTAARLCFGTTAGFGIYYGSNAPTVSAAQGSIYLRSDGSSTSTRMYVNTNGTTGWTAVTTAT